MKASIGAIGILLIFIVGLAGHFISRKYPEDRISRRMSATDKAGRAEVAINSPATGGSSNQASELKPKRFDIGNFSAGEADKAWNAAMGARTESDQTLNLYLVVSRMSRLGMTSAAIEKILTSFGPGKSRSYLISTAFMCSDPKKLGDCYARLQFEDEKFAAREGLALGMADTLVRSRSSFRFDASEYAFAGQGVDEILTKCIERYITGMVASPSGNVEDAFETAFKTPMSDSVKSAAISKLARIAPFESWEQLSAHDLATDSIVAAETARNMISKDAANAMEVFAKNPAADRYLAPGFYAWMIKDSARPIEWLQHNKNFISPSQKDAAIQGITKYALDQHEYDVATQWAKQIQSEKDKSAILQEIEKLTQRP